MNNFEFVPTYNDRYTISRDGIVYTCRRNKYLNQHIHRRYYRVTLHDGLKAHLVSVARLVALTFIPNPMCYPQINHIDGNKLNNRASNLEWCNQSQNNIHAHKNGLMGGERHASSKITAEQARAIKKRLANGEGAFSIAKDYPITGEAVCHIKRGKNWKYA